MSDNEEDRPRQMPYPRPVTGDFSRCERTASRQRSASKAGDLRIVSGCGAAPALKSAQQSAHFADTKIFGR